MLTLLTILTCGLARRGAGGGFVTWGLLPEGENNLAHGLGALMVGLAISGMVGLGWWPVLSTLWFLGTKPSPRPCFKLINESLSLGNYIGAVLRMAYFLPLAVLVYVLGLGSPIWFLMVFILPLPYYVGMRLLRDGDKAVEFGEWGYGLIGLMLVNLAV